MGIHAFRAMGTEIELLSDDPLPPGTAVEMEAWFETVEEALSRFRPDSELTLLNATAGRPFAASPLLLEVLGLALDASRRTGGLFDPTVLHEVRAAGYRESDDYRRGTLIATAPPPSPGWKGIEITRDGCVVLPPGVGIDLGGLAKGWAVDRAAGLLPHDRAWLLNAGGDLLARGNGPSGDGWLVGVEDPTQPGTDVAVLRARNRAVATSSTMRRRWLTDGGAVSHHLIDPRTGRPAETDLASVTVVARTVAQAEVMAKRLLLSGSAEARAIANGEDISAVLIDSLGRPSFVDCAGTLVAP
jgi:thiamine biosynthesis lipoprotein